MTRGLLPPEIQPGLEGSCTRVVTKELTLAQIEPTWPAVFSTPAMIGMMEYASSRAILPSLPAGSFQVGVRVEVDHLKAVPVGTTVTAISKLVQIDGRRLTFESEVRSAADDLIGRGRIFHAIVEHSRFLAIAAGKPSPR
jgi:fluoroacetyl-CoA thioesterase